MKKIYRITGVHEEDAYNKSLVGLEFSIHNACTPSDKGDGYYGVSIATIESEGFVYKDPIYGDWIPKKGDETSFYAVKFEEVSNVPRNLTEECVTPIGVKPEMFLFIL